MKIHRIETGVFLDHNGMLISEGRCAEEGRKREGRGRTMAGRILSRHNVSGDPEQLQLKFDAMVSPDNNYVNILQTAQASGIRKFPIPYVLSNCHNTLCAVGGTIPEDDHAFGLSNVKRYGGIFLPPYRGVLHQYMREQMAGCGRMILGSDSHTRYGALGTMGIGEGGGELVKQLLGQTYDIAYPPVIAIRLTGAPAEGVGPMDVALAIIAAAAPGGFHKNKVLEFVGEGIRSLSMEYRMGIDVMMTESAALSSIWCTDEETRDYLREHRREAEYQPLAPEDGAYYDGMLEVDLSRIEPMIALPFHPSNTMPIREFQENMEAILRKVEAEGNRIKGGNDSPFSIMQHLRDGAFYPDQALVSGCAGGMFENIAAVADILWDGNGEMRGIPGEGISLHVNPASLPVMEDLMSQGIASELAAAGVTLRPCICGPCFGVTDVPANNQLSIRHVTRNYPNREGSRPGDEQMAAVCLMDARSIAATVRNGGRLTAATELSGVRYRKWKHHFNPDIYRKQVYDNFGGADEDAVLIKGPNIADWPEMPPLKRHLLLRIAGVYQGSVTTDELIPSGEASSYRSNPEKLSAFTLCSRDPAYVGRAKAVRELERVNFELPYGMSAADDAEEGREEGFRDISFGSVLIAEQIGDGSSREQAASCQRVLGGFANLALEYSTKRYRSNLINWGLLPLRTETLPALSAGEYLLAENIGDILKNGEERVELRILRDLSIESEAALRTLNLTRLRAKTTGKIQAVLDPLTEEERKILLAGSLVNYYRG
ncbi:MAG: hydratase [Oribacterium sp.]